MDWRLYFHVDGEDAFGCIEYLTGDGWFRAEILKTGVEFHSSYLPDVLDWLKLEYKRFYK